MLKVHRNSKGFTLIELLIVIAIIGILAAIAIPAYTGYTRKARVQEIVHSMGAVKTAVMAYYTEKSAGPANATTAAQFRDNLGVDIPTKYLTAMVVTPVDAGVVGSTITATLGNIIGGDTNGTTAILESDNTYKNWLWRGTLPAQYMPKN
jgi:type IV pilus assembly protein PilA